MIFISQNLLEMIIVKREFIWKQREHSAKQKNLDLKLKLKVMQQSTDKQLDDKVAGKINKNVAKTGRTILSSNLTPNAFKRK